MHLGHTPGDAKTRPAYCLDMSTPQTYAQGDRVQIVKAAGYVSTYLQPGNSGFVDKYVPARDYIPDDRPAVFVVSDADDSPSPDAFHFFVDEVAPKPTTDA